MDKSLMFSNIWNMVLFGNVVPFLFFGYKKWKTCLIYVLNVMPYVRNFLKTVTIFFGKKLFPVFRFFENKSRKWKTTILGGFI